MKTKKATSARRVSKAKQVPQKTASSHLNKGFYIVFLSLTIVVGAIFLLMHHALVEQGQAEENDVLAVNNSIGATPTLFCIGNGNNCSKADNSKQGSSIQQSPSNSSLNQTTNAQKGKEKENDHDKDDKDHKDKKASGSGTLSPIASISGIILPTINISGTLTGSESGQLHKLINQLQKFLDQLEKKVSASVHKAIDILEKQLSTMEKSLFGNGKKTVKNTLGS